MRTFPENMLDLLWFNASLYVLGYGIRDPRFEIVPIEVVRPDRTHVRQTTISAYI